MKKGSAYVRCMGPWPRCGHADGTCTACPEYQAEIPPKPVPSAYGDPRIDPLGAASIMTATQLRLAFAPHDPKAKVVALSAVVPPLKISQMAAMMRVGRIHFQVKEGFGEERHIELSGPEILMLIDLADRFITSLPKAAQSNDAD